MLAGSVPGWRDQHRCGRASRLEAAQVCPCSLPTSGQCLAAGSVSLFLLSALSHVGYLSNRTPQRVKSSFLHGMWMQALHKGFGSSTSAPSTVQGCLELEPSLPTQSDRYPSLCQPLPQKMALKHLNTGDFCPSSHFRVKTFLSFHKLL